MSQSYSLKQIAEFLGAKVQGDDAVKISGLGTLSSASSQDLAFVSNPKYIDQLAETQAGAVILAPSLADKYQGNCLLVDDAYLGYAKISAWFDKTPKAEQGIHPSACIDSTAVIGDQVSIGPNVVVEANAKVGKGSIIKANTQIGGRSEIGENSLIAANVTVYHDVRIGDRVTIHSGAVLGADGFGFAPNENGVYSKIPQIGNVVIEDNVDIGAATTIDRATLGSTIIRTGVKLDNQIQIAHNVEIGKNTVIAAQTGVAGSTKIGEHCQIGGQVGIAGHITIGNNVRIQAQSGIGRNVKDDETLQGSPALNYGDYNKSYVHFKNLPKIMNRLNTIEKNITND